VYFPEPDSWDPNKLEELFKSHIKAQNNIKNIKKINLRGF